MIAIFKSGTHKIETQAGTTVSTTPRSIPTADFLDRLSFSTLGNISVSNDAIVKGLLYRLQNDNNVNLDSENLIAGLDYLVGANLLTEAEKTKLLA